MKKTFLALLLVTVSFSGYSSDKSYGNVPVEEVTSIYDGDTFRVNIKGWPPIIGERIAIRVNGLDTPEIRGECQKEKELARKAKQITVQALRAAKSIELRNTQRGKYFRIVADVYVDGKDLKEMHFRAGTAKPYDGGKKDSWCK
ncbi:thermonuclease family protein [Endozoicomonas arenosclerae]|uniref:thermonuclease family protein n=1 Tax=Endozoicomonas arenosclerae TaxID=1633495 RepID=UPI000783E91A|nr:thermonuclease family protein [Endozoicomonas arenosclerae]